jgi:hypothetical protein
MPRRNRRVVLAALLVALGFSTSLLADKDKSQKGDVKGTVSSIDQSNINVKTKSGDSQSVPVNDKTRYTNGKAAAVMADVQPGMVVVVHVAPDGSAMEIHLIPVAAH